MSLSRPIAAKPDTTGAHPDTTSRRRRTRRGRSSLTPPFWMVLPSAVVFLFVIIVPSIRGAYYSFTDWNGLNPSFDFVGLANYIRAWNDPAGIAAVLRSLGFASAITVLQTAIGIALALGVNAKIRGRNFARVILFAPVIIMPIVAAYLWRFILGNQGPLNSILGAIFGPGAERSWLGEPALAFWSIVLVVVWQLSGITMAIYLAGLQGIPEEILDAAAVDGAGKIRTFFSIVFPLLKPATTINVLLTLMGSLKLFDQVWVMTAGGPGTSTENLGTTIYKKVFIIGDFSYGVTFAVALTILVAVLAIIQYYTLQRGTGS